jgi:hypothetical protein
MSEIASGQELTGSARPRAAAPDRRVPFRWRWWPYALLQPILTIALFVPNQIPFLDAATAGAFVLFARGRFGLKVWAIWLALAASLALASRSTGMEAAVRAAGFAGILVLGFLASRADVAPETRGRAEEAAAICLAIPVMGFTLIAARDLHPTTYDPVLARLDSLAPPIAWRLAREFALNADFSLLCQVTYFALPLALALVGELERGQVERVRSVFVAAGLAAVFGLLAYQVVPATGPKYAFEGYPMQDPLLGAFERWAPWQPLVPRNAMPSLHVTWAMLIAWHAARTHWIGGLAGGAFLILTVVATLASGEHYVVDLVMAVPFAIAIAAMAARNRRLATIGFVITGVGLLGIACLAQ